jgi:hypothetical protein
LVDVVELDHAIFSADCAPSVVSGELDDRDGLAVFAVLSLGDRAQLLVCVDYQKIPVSHSYGEHVTLFGLCGLLQVLVMVIVNFEV